jgi:hypothetical protein
LTLEPLEGRTLLSFFPAVNYTVGLSPSSVAVGDFNGDGARDLVVSNRGDNTVSVLLGNGDGTFRDAVAYPTGSAPAFVAVGDFNGDGRLDIVTADSGSNTLSVLLGNGDGTFQDALRYNPHLTPTFVAVGDFNGDGRLDLAVTGPQDDTINVLLGNGDGTFRDSNPRGVGLGPVAMVLGDFNNDGRLDIAVANRGRSVSILLGNGDGTFRRFGDLELDETTAWLAGGDFNGDGKLDLATINDTAADGSWILLGNGNGTFATPIDYGCGVRGGLFAVAPGDFNRDGNLDLVRTHGAGLEVELGNGDGSFQCNGIFDLYPAGREPIFTAVADFNGDGFPDLATANRASNNVSVLLNDGNWSGGGGGSGQAAGPSDAAPDQFEVAAVAALTETPRRPMSEVPQPVATMPEHLLPSLPAERLDALFAASMRQNQLLPFFSSPRQVVSAVPDDWDDALGRNPTWLEKVGSLD